MHVQKFLSISDAGTELGISRSGVYRLIATGELNRVLIGGRAKITRRSLDRYIDNQLAFAEAQGRR